MIPRLILFVLALIIAIPAAQPTIAAPADRFIHVQVQEAKKNGADVNVNLPLQVAEQVLPTIDRGPLHNGRITIPQNALQGIDVRTLLNSIRTAPDGDYVTVKDGQQNVNVTKSKGNLIVHVTDAKQRNPQNVEVTVPLSVVDALFADAKTDEINLLAALNALDKAGDSLVVNVQDASDHVRVWIDNNNEPQ